MNAYGPTATFIFGCVVVLALLVASAFIVQAVLSIAFGSVVDPAELRVTVYLLWAVYLAYTAYCRLSGTEGSD